MQIKSHSTSNNVVKVMKHVASTPTPHPATAPLGPHTGGFALALVMGAVIQRHRFWSCSAGRMMVHVDGSFLLLPGAAWGHLYNLANMQSHTHTSFLYWFAAPRYIQIYSIYWVPFILQMLFLLLSLWLLNPLLSASRLHFSN